MTRKVRHPYQILEADELIIGERYALILSTYHGLNFMAYVFGGIIKDNLSAINNPPITDPRTFTIHFKGLRNDGVDSLLPARLPTIVCWPSRKGFHIDWDYVETYFGEKEDCKDTHAIVVSERHWADDPKIHVLDWENPNDVIERKIGKTNKVVSGDWEQQVNAKRDAAMADFFGF
ncbi:hypothetical protein LCGC14_0220070 [marine sediment metagenome]|uniref:Uncharacterized protein n=1 Tax=marine sediment metagenome TaxID=412755 RepID=A0A0F9UUG5_9ZZZZ